MSQALGPSEREEQISNDILQYRCTTMAAFVYQGVVAHNRHIKNQKCKKYGKS